MASQLGTMQEFFFRTCPICSKNFTQEYSFNRHIKYCKRAQTKRKGRLVSCACCSKAKTKCSFEVPCTRCASKGLMCTYDRTRQAGLLAQGEVSQDLVLAFPSHEQLHDDTSAWFSQPTLFSQISTISLEPDLLRQPHNAPFNFADFNIRDTRQQEKRSSSMYMGHEDAEIVSLRTRRRDNRLMTGVSTFKPAARLIYQTLLSFPQMMLRRQTFPPFIHPHWNQAQLPEKLASCMSIAQLFVARTPETRPFLWRTIDAEGKHSLEQMHSLSAREIFSAVQAMVIYLIMVLIDDDVEPMTRISGILETIKILCTRFRELRGEYYCTSEDKYPSRTWDDWILAESRRRFTWLWFTLSLSVEAEIPTSDCRGLNDMPLMASKTMWEARSDEEWQTERAFYNASSPVTTLGELLEARRNPENPLNQQKLQGWEAGADKMASMLNIVLEFI